MKYSLIVAMMVLRIAASGQQAPCLLAAKKIIQGGVETYSLKNEYDTKRQLLQKREHFVNNETGNYISTEKYSYDKNGNVIEITTYINGNVSKSVFRKYDDKNKLIEEVTSLGESGKNYITKKINGNEEELTTVDGTVNRKITEKNNAGLPTTEAIVDATGNRVATKTYTYNARGELTVSSETEIPRNRTITTTYDRNSNGAVTEEIITVNKEPFRRIKNLLNATGELVEKSVYNRNNQLDYVITYTYDNKKNVTSESYFYNQQLITKTANTYDQNGNLVLQHNFDREKLVSSLTWEYICP